MVRHILACPAAYKYQSKGKKKGEHSLPTVTEIAKRHWKRRQVIAAVLREQLANAEPKLDPEKYAEAKRISEKYAEALLQDEKHDPEKYAEAKRISEKNAEALLHDEKYAKAQRVFEIMVRKLEPAVLDQMRDALRALAESDNPPNLGHIFQRAKARVWAALLQACTDIKFDSKKGVQDLGYQPNRANLDEFRKAGILKGKSGRPVEPWNRRSPRKTIARKHTAARKAMWISRAKSKKHDRVIADVAQHTHRK